MERSSRKFYNFETNLSIVTVRNFGHYLYHYPYAYFIMANLPRACTDLPLRTYSLTETITAPNTDNLNVLVCGRGSNDFSRLRGLPLLPHIYIGIWGTMSPLVPTAATASMGGEPDYYKPRLVGMDLEGRRI